jgi:hypothetical protein
MSVYGYILQKNRVPVGRSDFHFVLFFHFISHMEIPDCGPIRIQLLFHVHLPRFGDILIWINRSKTLGKHCSKVFHIWHSDPYMDWLCASREYT